MSKWNDASPARISSALRGAWPSPLPKTCVSGDHARAVEHELQQRRVQAETNLACRRIADRMDEERHAAPVISANHGSKRASPR
ncbi:hypothetical protein [Cupriavidus oxalaticus]|uniref:hypothetical protein n=1 Tax=Cupriavidus oxalaticus TaxID=96344 RepID=UPI003F732EF6